MMFYSNFDYDEKYDYGVLIGILNEYQMVSNQESGLSRIDIALLPITRLARGFVLELKVVKYEEELPSCLCGHAIRSRHEIY